MAASTAALPNPGRHKSEASMKISVFIGTSLDGFIARCNGSFDFLPEGGGEPHGYNEFIASVDTLVIGRMTFEAVMGLPEWPYGDRRVVVLSGGKLDLSAVHGGRVEQMSGDPAEIAAKLEASGVRHVYVDGGVTIQRFLRAGLIQRMTITRVPVLIGEGIPLFGALGRDVKLRHVATQAYASGLVKSEYEVV
jgi:dihydrofolate reductase